MPVFYICRNVHHITGMKLSCRLAPFLIIAAPCSDEQNLPAAVFCTVDMPVIAAAWFECDISDVYLLGGKHV